jgi:hypothetical protein
MVVELRALSAEREAGFTLEGDDAAEAAGVTLACRSAYLTS